MKKAYNHFLFFISIAFISFTFTACELIPNPLDKEEDNEPEATDSPEDYSDVSVWVDVATITKPNQAVNLYILRYTIKYSGISSSEIREFGATTIPAQYSPQNSQAVVTGSIAMGYISCSFRNISHSMVTIGPYIILNDGTKLQGQVKSLRY